MTRRAREEALPLSPIEFSVLLVLAEESLYGYAIVSAIAERSAGAVKLASGNLYQVLNRLLSKGWIRELERRDVPGTDSRRRYYGLTREGRAVMTAEAARLRVLVQTAERLEVI